MAALTRRGRWPLWILITLLVAGSILALWSPWGVFADTDGSGESLRTVLEVISLIKTQYFEDVDALRLISKYVERGTINGMLSGVLDDPYTRHMDVRAWEQMQIDTHGVYGGIGIMVGMQEDKLTIVAPFAGTPGFAAGLRAGDHIVEIDGKSTEFMSLDEAVSLMRGPEGTMITLRLKRRTGEEYEAVIERAVIEVPSVSRAEAFESGHFPGQSLPIGYIRLQRFSDRTSQEMRDALTMLDDKRVAGLILDLRDNPGGTFNAAVEVANQFLPEGSPIVHIVSKDQPRKTYFASKTNKHNIGPMVILVNEFTASASEILSGALQDQGYATLVGQKTFGKGSVQLIVPLRDGSALALTSSRYQTASGRNIHQEGIEPDVVAELPESEEMLVIGESLENDLQFLTALDVLMRQIVAQSAKAG